MSQPPTRILFVHHNPDTYGASRSLLRLLGRLPRERYVPIVLLAADGPLRPLLQDLGVEVLVHPVSVITRPVFRSWRLAEFLAKLPLSVLFVWRLIRRRQIHLVHTNTGVIASAGLAAKLAGVPHVWHIRDWFQEFKAAWGPYSKYIVWASHKVVAVSNAVAQQFPPNDRVAVVHNGFSLDEFAVPKAKLAREFRERFQLGQEFLVGCVGRIKLVRKGQEVLVKAAALLEKKGRRAKYVFVGAPFPGNENHLAELQQLVRDHSLSAQVVFTGELPDARPAYAAMDVMVLPSAQPEPFGGVVMEAMAMGVPVIATNIGGSTDQVADGVTGFLVPPADPAALATKIELLMSDAHLRFQLGQAGPVRIAREFSLEKMVGHLETIYQEALSTNPHHGKIM